ncbi:MAG: DUF927 domain-containing protein [Rhizomicrobium sp.]|nr:DUF927 domain-containing protein [Rhizomicrobium sp.]
MHTESTNTRPWFTRDEEKTGKDGKSYVVTIRLCTPVSIEESVINEDTPNRDRILRLKYLDEEEKTQFVDLPASIAVKASGNELISRLRALGILMTKDGIHHLIEMVRENQPPDAIHQYSHLGWRDDFFLCPNGEAVNTNRHVEILTSRPKEYIAKNGTLEGWKNAAHHASQHYHFGLAVCLSFVGVLIDLLKIDTVVVVFTGESSYGKSTSQKIGASAWGDAREGKGQFVSCLATSNATEALLEHASGSYLGMDEAAHMDGKQLKSFIFGSSGGTGKTRLNQHAEVKQTRSWNTIATMSSEHGVAQKLRADGENLPGGVTVRTMEVSYDDMPSLPGDEMARIEAAFDNVGHAGAKFARQVVDDGYVTDRERLRGELAAIAQEIAGKDATSQLRRAAMIPALVQKAGEIAKRCGLLPAEFDPAAVAHKMWAGALASDIAPASNHERALNALRLSILTRKDVDIVPLDGDANRPRVGWYLNDEPYGEDVFVIPTNEADKLSGGVLEGKSLGKALAAADMLVLPKSGKGNAHDYIKGLGKVRSYIIKASAVEGDARP